MNTTAFKWMIIISFGAFLTFYAPDLVNRAELYSKEQVRVQKTRKSLDSLEQLISRNRKMTDSLVLSISYSIASNESDTLMTYKKSMLDSIQSCNDLLLSQKENKSKEIMSRPNEFFQLRDFIFLIILLGSILIAIASRQIELVARYIKYKLNDLSSDYVFNYIKLRIQYLDGKGKLVSVKRDDHISKISIFRDRGVTAVPFNMEGAILRSETYSVNSSFTFSSKCKVVFHRYFSNKNIIKRQHYSSYVFTTKNSFLKESEFWIFTVKEYCVFYRVEVIIPSELKLINAKLYHKEIGKKQLRSNDDEVESLSILDEKNDGWTEYESPVLLIIRELKHTVISVNLTGLRKNDCYKLTWDVKR